MIPKIIHQIWYQGENNIPPLHKDFQSKCKELYPEPNWTYMFWTEKSITELIENEYPNLMKYFKGFPHLLQKIDFARYIILYHYGGCYIDMDVECLRSIEELLKDNPNANFICSEMVPIFWFLHKYYWYDKFLNNGIFLASKNNPILAEMISEDVLKQVSKPKWWNITTELVISNSTGVDFFSYICLNFF